MTDVKVETFDQAETELGELSPDVEAEALDLIDRLGLEGQEQLRADPDAGGGRSVYRQMTAEEKAVYGILCPTEVDLSAYDGGPVPVRVMKEAERAREHFDELHVWWAGEAPNPDPVLVGVKEDPETSWRTTEFIIARWGSELLPFDDLREKAKEIYRKKLESVAHRMKKHWEGVAEVSEHMAEQRVSGDTSDLPNHRELP